mgnify:CR=1 FL=1
MKSLDLRNPVVENDVRLETIRLIIFLIVTFFFGAMITAIQRSIQEEGWFGFKKCSRIRQPKEKMKALETIAI